VPRRRPGPAGPARGAGSARGRHQPRHHHPRPRRVTTRTVAVVGSVLVVAFGAWFGLVRRSGPSGAFLAANEHAVGAAHAVVDGLEEVGRFKDLERLGTTINASYATMQKQLKTFRQLARDEDGDAAAIAADAKKSAAHATTAIRSLADSLILRMRIGDAEAAFDDLNTSVAQFDRQAARWKKL
jgi:hypothetical protein